MAKQTALEKFLEHARRQGGILQAMGRELVKDVRGTLHQVAFGTPEHPSEPGTPLNPTPQIVTGQVTGKKVEDLWGYAKDQARDADQRMERGRDKGSLGMDLG